MVEIYLVGASVVCRSVVARAPVTDGICLTGEYPHSGAALRAVEFRMLEHSLLSENKLVEALFAAVLLLSVLGVSAEFPESDGLASRAANGVVVKHRFSFRLGLFSVLADMKT